MNSLVYTDCLAPLRIIFKGSRRAIGVDLPSIGEVQFLRSVLEGFAERFPSAQIWIFHRDDTAEEFNEQIPHLKGRIFHVPFRRVREPWFRKLDLYITTEQFSVGPAGVYTLTLFHGQPSKGVTFGMPGSDPLSVNDALFLYGPLQRRALEEHLAIFGRRLPDHLALFDVGYTKSDDLINGYYDRNTYLTELGLDPQKKTVIYAPAFNEGASLRECGLEILDTLCSMKEFNVLAKLAIDCLRPTTDLYATGGVDWFSTIGRLERDHDNFRLVRSYEADPALAASDVLITCISSIGFEFLVLGRPVIYIDTPKFYSGFLRSLFPGIDTTKWVDRNTVNGGREFGEVVSSPQQLPQAIANVLSQPEKYLYRLGQIRELLLFNPGRATAAALDRIASLLKQRVRSTRPQAQAKALLDRRCGHVSFRARVNRAVTVLLSKPKAAIQQLLNSRGYTLAKIGEGYIDAADTVAAARAKGMSVCDYRESLENHPRKRGRRDRIIAKLAATGVFANVESVCEIGAGTGMYLEKVIERACPKTYEVYETSRGWVEFLQSEYSGRPDTKVVCHRADGRTLSCTPSASCDLIHAHAVFVYLPLLQTLRYLTECVRVCRPGGYIVFDCFIDSAFSLRVSEAWLAGEWDFPVVVPKMLLEEFAAANGLMCVETFSEIYGSGSVTYFVWQKAGWRDDRACRTSAFASPEL